MLDVWTVSCETRMQKGYSSFHPCPILILLMHLNNKPVAWHFDVDKRELSFLIDTLEWLLACLLQMHE